MTTCDVWLGFKLCRRRTFQLRLSMQLARDMCGTREMVSSSEQPQDLWRCSPSCPENQLASWWSWNVDSTLASLKECLQRSRTLCFMMFYDDLYLCVFVFAACSFCCAYSKPWSNLCWEVCRWDHLEPSCQKVFVEFLVWWCFWKPWHLIYLRPLKGGVGNKAFTNRVLNDLVLQNGVERSSCWDLSPWGLACPKQCSVVT